MPALMSRLIRLGLITLAVVLVAATTLFVLGGRSRDYSAQVQIDAPAEVVFHYLTDPHSFPRWVQSIERIEPLTAGETQVGSQARVYLNDEGRRSQMIDEVLELLPGESILLESTGAMISARNAFHLTPGSAGKTVLSHTLILRPKGWLRIVIPFMNQQVEQRVRSDLQSLKQLVESEPTIPTLPQVPLDTPSERPSP